MDKAGVLAAVAAELDRGDLAGARDLILADYPFVPLSNVGRKYSILDSTRVFARDGFLDRYSGMRLVFPGALRLLSDLMPDIFPHHPHWRTDKAHFAYWELFPTIDHVVPVSRGGEDADPNWVTTSMLRNAAKSNFTIEELGWKLRAPGNLEHWDGLMGWFVKRCAADPALARDARLRAWYRASLALYTSNGELPPEPPARI